MEMKKYRVICAVFAFILFLAAALLYMRTPETVVLYKDSLWQADGFKNNLTRLDSSIETVGGAFVPTKEGDYKAALSFWGIPYKSVTIKVLEEKEVIPGGETVGIRLYSDNLVVVAVSSIQEGEKSPAEEAGIKPGDVILTADGKAVKSAEELSAMVEESESEIVLEVKNGDEKRSVSVMPKMSQYDGRKKLGVWVRNSTAGVGTLSFIEPEEGIYGALGHGVSDSDTGVLFDILKGSIEKCSVAEITKSAKGAPGEMKGVFYRNAEPIGGIDKNTKSGIFGRLYAIPEGERMKVGLKNTIKKGDAVIRTSLDGDTVEEYSVKILRVSQSAKNPSKGIMLEVTDERLLEKTGGIVQGMSGSPIIQDGKFIGAVTHVLVNDPKKGYGVTAEVMLCAASE